MLSRIISVYVEMTILFAYEVSFKAQSQQRKIKLSKITWLKALK